MGHGKTRCLCPNCWHHFVEQFERHARKPLRPPLTNGYLSDIGAVDVKLTDEEIKELEAPYIPQAPYGHN
ncbi:hypothetical protein BJ912DRAFT_669143 [Pholiota molesta]|nr:hypothetical protein BJ912DRAFT_669143 [Pholiota molesta]